MPNSHEVDIHKVGRFDQSFLVHMIKDFFVVLLVVTALEFGLKAALVYYNYMANGPDEVAGVAEDIAGNVRSIMLNDGGPVAARTLYPILERNWSELGYEIAVTPAAITIDAIREGFGFVPQGIPATNWSEGTFQEASVAVKAEEFCLACHATANIGDTLGTITVRNYLARDFALWWSDIRLTAGLAVGKIVLHSILLFILLRARLEPLLRLRTVVSTLARAYGGLGERAEIRSSDEFGALSRDLNLFLDRITRLVGELDTVLNRVVSVNDDIIGIQGTLRDQVDTVVRNTRHLERRAMMSAKREPLLSDAWFDAVQSSIADLDTALAKTPETPEATRLLDSLRAVVSNAEAQIKSNEDLFRDLATLGEDTERFQSALAEMTRLEERMKAIIETGTDLVRRLRPNDDRGTPAE